MWIDINYSILIYAEKFFYLFKKNYYLRSSRQTLFLWRTSVLSYLIPGSWLFFQLSKFVLFVVDFAYYISLYQCICFNKKKYVLKTSWDWVSYCRPFTRDEHFWQKSKNLYETRRFLTKLLNVQSFPNLPARVMILVFIDSSLQNVSSESIYISLTLAMNFFGQTSKL